MFFATGSDVDIMFFYLLVKIEIILDLFTDDHILGS